MRATTSFLGTMRRAAVAAVAVAAKLAVVATVAVMAGVVAPAALRAAAVDKTPRFENEREQRRLRLALSLVPGRTEVGGRVDSTVVLYRFRVIATDRSGATAAEAGSTPEWEATVFVAPPTDRGAPPRSLVQLSSRSRDVTLPRPLGYRLEAGDSIAVHVVGASTARVTELQLVVDYEVGAGIASRLAVSPLPARAWEPDGHGATFAASAPGLEWRWTPDHDGRLLAIAGLPLEWVRDAVLEDAESGETLWTSPLRDASGRSVFGKGGDVVRLGVAVQAGRTYRLRATPVSVSVDSAARGELLALVLPSAGR